MSGEHTKNKLMTWDKPGSLGKKNEGKTPSKEAGDKHKEDKDESTSSINSHKKGDKKKKKMKKVVYYETDSVGHLFSNAVKKEQGNIIVKDKVLCLPKHYLLSDIMIFRRRSRRTYLRHL
jgi:hypothetical protein